MKLVELFLLTTSLVSCGPTYSKISDKSPDKNIGLSDYLSITYTKYTNGTDTNDGMPDGGVQLKMPGSWYQEPVFFCNGTGGKAY
ncbi:hypothetical protein [Paenibacillus sp. TH7-28]